MTGSDQKQIRHHRGAKGLFNMLLMATDLVLAQSQVRFQLAVALLNRPVALIATHHLSRRPFGQIGQQDFRLVGVHARPFLAQNHSDVTDVTKTQTFAVNPVRVAPFGARQTRPPVR